MNFNKLFILTILVQVLINTQLFAQQDTALTVTNNGDLGVGTTVPKARLHIFSPEGSNGLWIQAGDAYGDVLFHIEDSDRSLQVMHIEDDGLIGLGTTTPQYPIHLWNGAYVSHDGQWIYTGLTSGTAPLSKEVADSVLKILNPVMIERGIRRRSVERIGFIAEEVPEMIAPPDKNGLNPIYLLAILTKVVQEQQNKIAELDSLLNANK